MTQSAGPADNDSTLRWDVGTAYELFVSLDVLHEPELFDLRPAWAAKIRARIPAPERTFLEETSTFNSPFGWVHNLSQPKNTLAVLSALQQIAPARRSIALLNLENENKPESKCLMEIAERGSWDRKDMAALMPILCKEETSKKEQALVKYLNWWSRPEDFGRMLLSALQAYHQAFFEQEEKRVEPILQTGLQHAQQAAERLSIPDLITELSRGIRYAEAIGKELIIVPTFWMTPLVHLGKINENQTLFLFGVRPPTMSLIPGELVPDGLLISLKALADPTRLKILRYLSEQELTPSELSRRLNLRAPTVTHHLKELRLAGLVNVTLHGQEKLYRARLEALEPIHMSLRDFLKSNSTESDPQ